jgi:hypothetical protein
MDGMNSRTLPARFTLLAILGAAGLALLAATPADAIIRSYEPADTEAPAITRTVVENTNETVPVDENGKKSCEYRKWDGGTGYYPHGTVITVKLPDGASKSMKCNDGDWEAALTKSYDLYVDQYFVASDGALVLLTP